MLEVTGLRAGYGPINVLWDLSLNITAGSLTTILGSNGAGKTTLLRAIMGLVPVTQGEIRLNGQVLSGVPTWEMVERGVAMIPEGRMVFRDMSVEENLIMGAYPRPQRQRLQDHLGQVYVTFPRLKERRRQFAGSLSGGEAQMLAIGRGLMSQPQTILIDEPSLGLAPVAVQELFAILESLKGQGRTLVLVEQNTHMALSVADHAYLIQNGKVVLSQAAAEVNLDQLHDLYFAR